MRALLFAYLLALVLACLAPAYSIILSPGFQNEPGCTTDTACMLHCPPPADDPDCDGGPQ